MNAKTTRNKSWGVTTLRWLVAILLIALGSAAVPAGLVASWLKNDVLDTENFVATYAPLAEDADFQDLIAAEVTTVATGYLEEVLPTGTLNEMAGGVAGFLDYLPVDPSWAEWVGSLPGDLEDQAGALIYASTQDFLASGQFPPLWENTLRQVHSQVVGIMAGTEPLANPEQDSTYLAVSTGPLVEAIKSYLQDRGAWWAQFLPEVDEQIQIVELSSVSTLQSLDRLIQVGPTALAIIASVLILGGLAIAPARGFALAGAGLASALANGVAWMSVQSYGENNVYAILGDDRTSLSQHIWDLTVSPLYSPLSMAVWVSLGVAAAALLAAVITRVWAGNRRKKV